MQRIPLRNLAILHLNVLILGFTAILGKLISIEAIQLVWYRTAIAAVILFLFVFFLKQKHFPDWKANFKIVGIGLIVAAHWICFFHAIKVSNVSVTLGVLSTTTLFTSLLEPIFTRNRISLIEVLVGLLIIGGIYIIFRFETHYFLGIVFGLGAAFLASIFSVLNKTITEKHDSRIITLIEMLSAFTFITFFMLITGQFEAKMLVVNWSDIIYLLILGGICTAYAFSATVSLMRDMSAYYVVLAINLEPIYGILLAFWIFGASELMTTGFYVGASVILSAVFIYPVLKRKWPGKVVKENEVNV